MSQSRLSFFPFAGSTCEEYLKKPSPKSKKHEFKARYCSILFLTSKQIMKTGIKKRKVSEWMPFSGVLTWFTCSLKMLFILSWRESRLSVSGFAGNVRCFSRGLDLLIFHYLSALLGNWWDLRSSDCDTAESDYTKNNSLRSEIFSLSRKLRIYVILYSVWQTFTYCTGLNFCR